MQNILVKPRIEAINPNICFISLWQLCYSRFLDPELRTHSFRIAHQVLPTNARLFQYGIGNTANCTFCGVKFCETLEHLLINCKQAKVVWRYVERLLYKLCNHRLKIDSPTLLFCSFQI